jgi:hypothetical protein
MRPFQFPDFSRRDQHPEQIKFFFIVKLASAPKLGQASSVRRERQVADHHHGLPLPAS